MLNTAYPSPGSPVSPTAWANLNPNGFYLQVVAARGIFVGYDVKAHEGFGIHRISQGAAVVGHSWRLLPEQYTVVVASNALPCQVNSLWPLSFRLTLNSWEPDSREGR